MCTLTYWGSCKICFGIIITSNIQPIDKRVVQLYTYKIAQRASLNYKNCNEYVVSFANKSLLKSERKQDMYFLFAYELVIIRSGKASFKQKRNT